MLFATPSLTPDDHRVVDEIEALRSEFRHRLAQPRRWEGQLRRSLTAAAIRGSTHIEGYTISSEDAETLIAGGDISPETDEATRNAVTGYRDALTYIQHAADFQIFAWRNFGGFVGWQNCNLRHDKKIFQNGEVATLENSFMI